MQNTENNAQILDFNAFREQASQPEQPNTDAQFTPMLVWYPMWVMVPNPSYTPPAS